MKEPWEFYSLSGGLEDRYEECPECGGDILISGPELLCECGFQKILPYEDREDEDW